MPHAMPSGTNQHHLIMLQYLVHPHPHPHPRQVVIIPTSIPTTTTSNPNQNKALVISIHLQPIYLSFCLYIHQPTQSKRCEALINCSTQSIDRSAHIVHWSLHEHRLHAPATWPHNHHVQLVLPRAMASTTTTNPIQVIHQSFGIVLDGSRGDINVLLPSPSY